MQGVGIVPIGESFALFVKAGFFSWSVEAFGITDDGTDGAYGVGGQVHFGKKKNWGARLEWERFADVSGGDVDMISVGVVFRFGQKSANASSGKLTPSPAPATTTALAPTTIAIDAPATRPDKERELLRSIAGKWRGDGISARGTAYSITYIFREDGSFNISWRWGTNADRGQYPPGTLRVIGSHFEHKNPDGRLWTITLHKDKKGRRLLKGRRQDGNKWELKEQK